MWKIVAVDTRYIVVVDAAEGLRTPGEPDARFEARSLKPSEAPWEDDLGYPQLMGQNILPWILWLTAASLLVQGCIVLKLRPVGQTEEVQREDLPRLKRLEGDRVYSFLGPDRIPAIDEPVLVPAAQADFMAEDEAVVGVIHEGQARAYSLWHLDRHEIVNDRFGGDPIAVTW